MSDPTAHRFWPTMDGEQPVDPCYTCGEPREAHGERWSDPINGKRPPHKRDHRPIEWQHILRLRAWAQEASAEHGCAISLVGSVLDHDEPRDVDIAAVWPAERFAAMFGPIPARGGTVEMARYMVQTIKGSNLFVQLLSGAQMATKGRYSVDVHLCPDTWFVEQPRWPLSDAARIAALEAERDAARAEAGRLRGLLRRALPHVVSESESPMWFDPSEILAVVSEMQAALVESGAQATGGAS